MEQLSQKKKIPQSNQKKYDPTLKGFTTTLQRQLDVARQRASDWEPK